MSDKVELLKENVKQAYGRIAQEDRCCGEASSESLGYAADQLGALPAGADQGLGCGNPLGFSHIKEGYTVLDLGSGGGIDCFIAAGMVGASGKVIGVDFTPQMIEKARRNAEKGKHTNVEFVFGDIERLPVEDGAVDLVISNCVINLTPDKRKVFEEIYRVLKPGGAFVISDIVWLRTKPDWIDSQIDTAGCVTGAIEKSELVAAITDAGFSSVDCLQETVYGPEIVEAAAADYLQDAGCCGSGSVESLGELQDSIASVTMRGIKAL